MTGSDSVREAEPDAVAKLTWGLRRYSLALVLLVLLAVIGSVVVQRSGPGKTYEASALVVATTLEINPLQLPRTVDAVFRGGSVAESVASKLAYAGPADGIVPDV